MRKLIGITLAISMGLASTAAFASDGESIYKSKCSSCHDLANDQQSMGLGPSFKQVADAYNANGGKDTLLAFFEGKRDKEPLVVKRIKQMKGQLKTIQKMSADERSALADFILSH